MKWLLVFLALAISGGAYVVVPMLRMDRQVRDTRRMVESFGAREWRAIRDECEGLVRGRRASLTGGSEILDRADWPPFLGKLRPASIVRDAGSVEVVVSGGHYPSLAIKSVWRG